MPCFPRNLGTVRAKRPSGHRRARATRVFRDGVKAAHWLGTPNPAFGGRAPLLAAKESPAGCALVCAILDTMVGGKELS